MNTQNKARLAAKAIIFLTALGAFICGMAFLMILERLIPLFNNLYILLVCMYTALFIALVIMLAGAHSLAKVAHLSGKNTALRLLLIISGVIATVYWQLYLNPIQISPLLENGAYTPLLTIAAVMLLSWLPYIFVTRKLF
ncbi:hypothetical protein LJB93_03195 [Desulfovibrio sp. OttesenSCG-928-F07]|nr:hypothetical protein [Desulfovibrio sp. OttesenSCG-928-F07]